MSVFRFKEFSVHQSKSAMKIGTDAMILGALINSSDKKKGLDIGAGTGVLSLMVAQTNSLITIQAIEIDTESSNEAELNFQNSPWSDRLKICSGDFINHEFKQTFDLIFSNPPYYENGLLNESLRKANTRHEESLPLNDLFEKVSQLLSSKGHFWLILPYETAQKWKMIAEDMNLFCIQEITVNGKPNLPKRTVFCFSSMKGKFIQKDIVIRNNDNSYSEEYKILTQNFHGVSL